MIFNDSITEFYTYRTAFTKYSMYITLNDNNLEDVKDFIILNGYQPENHISWKTSSGMCYTLSDGKLYIGTDLMVINW